MVRGAGGHSAQMHTWYLRVRAVTGSEATARAPGQEPQKAKVAKALLVLKSVGLWGGNGLAATQDVVTTKGLRSGLALGFHVSGYF